MRINRDYLSFSPLHSFAYSMIVEQTLSLKGGINMANTSQRKEVLNHLQSGKTITSMEAINLYGATRLSAIIFDLKDDGHNIVSRDVVTKNRYGHTTRYAEYSLVPKKVARKKKSGGKK